MKKQIQILPFIILLIGMMLLSRQFTYGCVVIASESMSPTVNKGDLILYKSYDGVTPIQEGTIILFQEEDKSILHRVVKYEENLYTTKGDNNTAEDHNKVSPENIEGIYLGRVPYIGYPSIWMHNFLKKVKSFYEK